MEIFGFVVSVWAAVLFGLFAVAMVVSCTFDRRGTEEPKWYVFATLIVFLIAWGWNEVYWKDLLFSKRLWVDLSLYLLIGLGYSIIEFLMEVRRSARYWAEEWKSYVRRNKGVIEALQQEFLGMHISSCKHRIIGITATDAGGIEPKINRSELAQGIGCWTFFWPFYAISLVIGDLLDEVWRVMADVLVSISGRFVRLTFKDVFK